jgi:hypothetical protein
MRGSASSRIVGFVFVFLILPSLQGVIVTYSTLLHPLSLGPPSLFPSHFPPRWTGLFSPSPIAPPTISWPSRLNDTAANGLFLTAMPLTRVDEGAFNVVCFGNSGWMAKKKFGSPWLSGPQYCHLQHPKRKSHS